MKIFPLNLKKQHVPKHRENNYEGITTWQMERRNSNDFPQQLASAVFNSPTATACFRVWNEFVTGDGFVDENLDMLDVGGKTLLDLHRKITTDLVLFNGFSIHISYNLEGKATSFTHLPFEQVRLGLIKGNQVQDIRFNPYFGLPDFENKHTKVFYTYNPDPEYVINQIKKHQEDFISQKITYPYPGQVFWYSIERPLSRVYPVPEYYSCYNWMLVENQIQLFHRRNVENNFLGSFIINKFGNPDQPVEGSSMTLAEKFEGELQQNFTGADNGGVVLVNYYMQENEKLDVTPISPTDNDKMFDVTINHCEMGILKGWNVPNILAGRETSGKLAASNEIINAVKLMQSRVNDLQLILSKVYSQIIPVSYDVKTWDIKNLNYVSILPDNAFEFMDRNEVREFLNENHNTNLQTDVD